MRTFVFTPVPLLLSLFLLFHSPLGPGPATSATASPAVYVTAPSALVSALHAVDNSSGGQLINALPALFGFPFRLPPFTASAVYAGDGLMSDGSNATFGCGSSTFNYSSNPVWRQLVDVLRVASVVLLIHRGGPAPCSFEEKVFNAQRSDGNVSAVLILDSASDAALYMREVRLGPVIHTPSFFLYAPYTDAILRYWRRARPGPQETLFTIAADPPAPHGQVTLSVFYGVTEDSAIPLLSQFATAAAVFNSSVSVVPTVRLEPPPAACLTNSTACSSSCVASHDNSSYYCITTVPSAQSQFDGVQGDDAVVEAMRQLCFSSLCQSEGAASSLMWQYWAYFYASSGDDPLTLADWSDPSAARLQRLLAFLSSTAASPISYTELTSCMQAQYQSGSTLPLLETAVQQWSLFAPLTTPRLYVDQEPYPAFPHCSLPMTAAACPLLRDICYELPAESAPAACGYPAACPFGTDCLSSSSSGVGPGIGGGDSETGLSVGGVAGVVIAGCIVGLLLVSAYALYRRRRQQRSGDDNEAGSEFTTFS